MHYRRNKHLRNSHSSEVAWKEIMNQVPLSLSLTPGGKNSSTRTPKGVVIRKADIAAATHRMDNGMSSPAVSHNLSVRYNSMEFKSSKISGQ
jgi:acyl-CoA synthetase (AMP-forming)/AMP-acid ligase II